jgi:hypothetical protein
MEKKKILTTPRLIHNTKYDPRFICIFCSKGAPELCEYGVGRSTLDNDGPIYHL